MLEPSNPAPSRRTSSSSWIGLLVCCNVPGTSTNVRSITVHSCSFAKLITSCAVSIFGRNEKFSSLDLGWMDLMADWIVEEAVRGGMEWSGKNQYCAIEPLIDCGSKRSLRTACILFIF